MLRMGQLLKLWLMVSRPLVYPLIPLLFILGYQAGGGAVSDFRIGDWLFVLALTWPLSMIIYGINDLADRDTDEKDKQRLVWFGASFSADRSRNVWWGVLAAAMFLLAAGYGVFGMYGVLFGIGIITASVLYSMPPVRIKTRPFLDIIFSGLMYGFCFYAIGHVYALKVLSVPKEAWLLALIAMVVHTLGALRDYVHDKEMRQRTIAVHLGLLPASIFAMALTVLTLGLWHKHRGLTFEEGTLFFLLFSLCILVYKRPVLFKFKYLQITLIVMLYVIGIYKVLL